MKTRIIAALTAVMMLMLAVPALATEVTSVEPSPKYETPEGYNDNDYQKMVTFLEIEDENGIKNGEKLYGPFDEDFDPNDPENWDGVGWLDGRIIWIDFCGKGLVGALDVSGFTALDDLRCYENAITEIDASGCVILDNIMCWNNVITSLCISSCTMLESFSCSNNRITELDFSDCPLIEWISCYGNKLVQLDVSGCAELSVLLCFNNYIVDLDVTGCSSLNRLDCTGNSLTELDFYDCPILGFDNIMAEGNGFIGYSRDIDEEYLWDYALAVPEEGEEFLGWFTQNGDLITEFERINASQTDETIIVARFTNETTSFFVSGDANGDGNVDATDALAVMRYAMRLGSLSPEALQACDVDGSGDVNATDALLILRAVMGLIDL